MAKIFNTAYLDEDLMKTLNNNEAAWIYNGLDCCVTAEIFDTLSGQMEDETPGVQETYKMCLNKLAPIMEMTLRGTYINEDARRKTVAELEKDLAYVDGNLQHLMRGMFDCELNWRSPVQLKNLFYGMLGLKEVKKRNAKGIYAATTNREALEHFTHFYHAKIYANHILVLRDLHKQLSFLKTELDKDQRIRCNYNLAGTNTGRLSSSMNDFGTGTNLQNVNRKLRFPFEADPGMYLVNIDLEQADGRNVGAICHNIFYDAPASYIAECLGVPEWNGPTGAEFASAYLDACEGGDLHTTVCKMVWPNLAWPEDEAEWKKFCDGIIAHGQDSYRQLAKKGGHGTNYYGTPFTMAKHLHVAQKIVENFQKNYFGAFPAIKAWHGHVIKNIKETGTIHTLFGRRRMFFGRGNDASTHRKAIAFEPQSCTGEQIDRGLHQVWKTYPQVQLLNQVHDSILFQVPYSEKDELIPGILDVMQVPLTLKGGRQFVVPLDAAGGWNWGYFDKSNPDANPFGLKGWNGNEERYRPDPKRRIKDYLK